MDEISPLGWVILGCVGFFVITLNISLLMALRNRDKPGGSPQAERSLQTLSRDPWEKENSQWKELSNRVNELKKPDKPSDPD